MAYYQLHNVAQAQQELTLGRQAAGLTKSADDTC